MLPIELCNLKISKPKYPYDVKVCRRMSILGNPFVLDKESDRDLVCDLYEDWFKEQARVFKPEILRLLSIYKEFGKLRLFCWCAPKRCHANTIRTAIMKEMEES